MSRDNYPVIIKIQAVEPAMMSQVSEKHTRDGTRGLFIRSDNVWET